MLGMLCFFGIWILKWCKFGVGLLILVFIDVENVGFSFLIGSLGFISAGFICFVFLLCKWLNSLINVVMLCLLIYFIICS